MGSPLTEDPEQRLYAALNNCGFVSTEARRHACCSLTQRSRQMLHSADFHKSKPFAFLMDAAMLGCDRMLALVQPTSAVSASGLT